MGSDKDWATKLQANVDAKRTPMLDRALAQVPQKEVRAKAILTPRPVKMNKTEQKYAHYLEALKRAGDIHYWRNHPMKLRLTDDNCGYNPDFLVITNEGYMEFHDTKAFYKKSNRVGITDDSLEKMKMTAYLFPFYRVMAVWEEGGEWKRRVF